jgi:hypothetical protein
MIKEVKMALKDKEKQVSRFIKTTESILKQKNSIDRCKLLSIRTTVEYLLTNNLETAQHFPTNNSENASLEDLKDLLQLVEDKLAIRIVREEEKSPESTLELNPLMRKTKHNERNGETTIGQNQEDFAMTDKSLSSAEQIQLLLLDQKVALFFFFFPPYYFTCIILFISDIILFYCRISMRKS